MTISRTERQQDFFRTMHTMVAAVGDNAAIHVSFSLGQPPVEDTLLTTWDELAALRWTDDDSSWTQQRRRLSPLGWAQGVLMDPPPNLDARCGQLAAAIKSTVRGRHDAGFTTLRELTGSCGLPEGWVWNAVQGNLLHHRFPHRGYRLDGFMDGIACHLTVPRTFGQEHLF